MPLATKEHVLTHKLGKGELLPIEAVEIMAFNKGREMVCNGSSKRDTETAEERDSEYMKEIKRLEDMNRERVDKEQRTEWERQRREQNVEHESCDSESQASQNIDGKERAWI